jgi:hypothetical protein
MYNRLFRNVYTIESSCTGLTQINLPWPAGQITLSNDHASGRTIEMYLVGSGAAANSRMTLAAGETVSFEFGTRAVALSAEASGVPFRFWALG